MRIGYMITFFRSGWLRVISVIFSIFYIDFLSYREYGSAMTGLTYRAIDYGPVPEKWDKIYSEFPEVMQEIRQCGDFYVLPSYLIFGLPFSSNKEVSHGLKIWKRQWSVGAGAKSRPSRCRYLSSLLRNIHSCEHGDDEPVPHIRLHTDEQTGRSILRFCKSNPQRLLTETV